MGQKSCLYSSKLHSQFVAVHCWEAKNTQIVALWTQHLRKSGTPPSDVWIQHEEWCYSSPLNYNWAKDYQVRKK